MPTAAERDPKGLYARHRAGEVTGLPGLDAVYEAPREGLRIDSDSVSVSRAVEMVLERLDIDVGPGTGVSGSGGQAPADD